ncbi:unnamed protein product [Eruca vesicaria subsp. sativa]|uniref:Uncharacterized protein n=1 Tax=Eruca vesicaria subsp. sativa TaxID=29727 RepID=A0ABC8JWR7_ERUVS|nr:unnamed protein product [Eruca vesicaria subsp. sativa]
MSSPQVNYPWKKPTQHELCCGFRGQVSNKTHKKETCKGGWKWKDSNKRNRNTIQGAMVAATDKEDGFEDVRPSSQQELCFYIRIMSDHTLTQLIGLLET